MSTWTIDAAHSTVEFKMKHLVVSTIKGVFGAFSGTLDAADDSFANASVSFEADVAGINTHNAQRDGHLQTPDFFDTAKFPKLTFVSTSFTKKTDSEYAVVGNLTMKGVTKEVTLKAIFNGFANGQGGKRIAALDVTGVINRLDFGITWNTVLDTGGMALSNEVWLDATIELKEA